MLVVRRIVNRLWKGSTSTAKSLIATMSEKSEQKGPSPNGDDREDLVATVMAETPLYLLKDLLLLVMQRPLSRLLLEYLAGSSFVKTLHFRGKKFLAGPLVLRSKIGLQKCQWEPFLRNLRLPDAPFRMLCPLNAFRPIRPKFPNYGSGNPPKRAIVARISPHSNFIPISWFLSLFQLVLYRSLTS